MTVIPDDEVADLRRKLDVCCAERDAALAGMSLSDYLLNEIRQVAERPTLEELRARLERRTPITPSIEPTEAIRAERDRQ